MRYLLIFGPPFRPPPRDLGISSFCEVKGHFIPHKDTVRSNVDKDDALHAEITT